MRAMDTTFKCEIIVCVVVFLVASSSEARYHGAERGVVSDSMHTSLLSATHDSFLQEEPLRNIAKRSSDWSKRQPLVAPKPELSPEPQASDTVEVSTKFPRVVRKMRLQNVSLSPRQLEEAGNVTSTFDKKGKVVRIRKFKRKTTEKPMTTTSLPLTTTGKPTTPLSTMHTPQVEFSHITVVNKEVRDQKPNRKQRNKKQPSLWVPTQGYGARGTDSNEMEVSAPINQIRPTERTHVRVPYREQKTVAKEARDDPVPRPPSPLNDQPRKPHDGTSKSRAETLSSGVPSEPVLTPAQRENSYQANYVHPERTQPETEHIHKDSSPASTNVSANIPPKSVEILSDLPPAPYDPRNQQPPYPGINQPGYSTHSPYTPDAGTDPGQALGNFGFQQYPQQGGPGFRSYLQDDPFFHQPWAQPPGGAQSRNGNPLPRGSFGQPFSPFYGRSNPQQFQNYPTGPYHRSGSFGTPEFYHSPRLLSLRRSVMDVYSDDEPMETTTEFSIPKFEVPSIDFNDKGCRTVYKEVNAVPAGGSNEGVENKAKSFVMTRECYFPDGVPTSSPLDAKEKGSEVSPGAEYV